MNTLIIPKENKKGILPLFAMVILGIIGLIVGIIILAGITNAIAKNILLILGIVIIFGSVYGAMRYSKKSKQILAIGVGIGLTLMVFHFLGFTQQTTLDTNYYIEAPFYGTVKCDPAPGGPEYKFKDIPPAQLTTISCPTNTKTCDILITSPRQGFFSDPDSIYWEKCDIKTNSCIPQTRVNTYNPTYSDGQGKLISYPLIQNMPTTQYIKMKFQDQKVFGGYDDVSYSATADIYYEPYKLWNINALEGGINPIQGS